LCDGCNNNNSKNTQTRRTNAKIRFYEHRFCEHRFCEHSFCEHSFLATVKSCKSADVVEGHKLYLVTSPFCFGDKVHEMYYVVCKTNLLCLNICFATTCFGHYGWSSSGFFCRILHRTRKCTVQLIQHEINFAVLNCFHGALYRGADKSLARPTSRCILFDG